MSTSFLDHVTYSPHAIQKYIRELLTSEDKTTQINEIISDFYALIIHENKVTLNCDWEESLSQAQTTHLIKLEKLLCSNGTTQLWIRSHTQLLSKTVQEMQLSLHLFFNVAPIHYDHHVIPLKNVPKDSMSCASVWETSRRVSPDSDI